MKDKISKFQCPRCKYPTLRLSAGATTDNELVPQYGYLVCDVCKTLYPIAQNILDLTVGQTVTLTLAGWSNDVPPTPQLYERIWRRRALTLMTGENFSVEREWKWLNDWTNIKAGESVVDLGTSTGLYARGLSERGATIFAVDAAWGMLWEAKKQIAREKRRGIMLVRAAAENLPFHDASMDAVVVGGSLNEMKSIGTALQESYRIVRRGGRMVVMSLNRATKTRGRLIQNMLGSSGIKFPTADEFNALAQTAGWKMANQEARGIVLFSLLTK